MGLGWEKVEGRGGGVLMWWIEMRDGLGRG